MKKILVLTFIVTILFCYGCHPNNGFPLHTVAEGKQNLIVYKAEKCDSNKHYGPYKYAVTDASGKGWTLYSYNCYQIGDTLRITNRK